MCEMQAVSGPCMGEGGVGGQKVIRWREKWGVCGDDKTVGRVEAVVGGAGGGQMP